MNYTVGDVRFPIAATAKISKAGGAAHYTEGKA